MNTWVLSRATVAYKRDLSGKCARAHDRSRPATQSCTAYHMNDRSGARSPPLPCLVWAPFCACASRSMLTVYTVVQTLHADVSTSPARSEVGLRSAPQCGRVEEEGHSTSCRNRQSRTYPGARSSRPFPPLPRRRTKRRSGPSIPPFFFQCDGSLNGRQKADSSPG